MHPAITTRIPYIIALLITLPVGLSTRKMPDLYHPIIAEFGGDVLWAMLVYWLIRFIAPFWPRLNCVVWALAFSYFIEISQLYHAPWLDYIRLTTLGKLVLGLGFLWSDIVCYAIGIFAGYLLDVLYKKLITKKAINGNKTAITN